MGKSFIMELSRNRQILLGGNGLVIQWLVGFVCIVITPLFYILGVQQQAGQTGMGSGHPEVVYEGLEKGQGNMSVNEVVCVSLQLHHMNKKITELRLQKEQQWLQQDPHHQAVVTRLDSLNFHFCLFGLEEDYARGFYHGVLELPEDYPFSPPKIKFLTENGRFEVGKPICTTFTHYHKETWSSSWNIRTILTGLISFMYSSEKGIGGVFDSPTRRKVLAKKSLTNNLSNPLFVELFKQKLIAREIVPQKEIDQLMKRSAERETKLVRQRKENLTSSECRDEEHDESEQKNARSMSLRVADTELKVVEIKFCLDKNEEEMQPRKMLHYEEGIPRLSKHKTLEENYHFG